MGDNKPELEELL